MQKMNGPLGEETKGSEEETRPHYQAWPDTDVSEDFSAPPLNAQQAQQWRQRHQALSPWKILSWQAVVVTVVAMLIWPFVNNSVAIISWFYGGFAIWLPAAMFAKLVVSKPSLGMLVVCEMVKLLLSLILIVLAPFVLGTVVWFALLGAIVLTVNMYWIAPLLMVRSGRV